MTRFEEDRYYAPDDPALRFIATTGTLAIWRHKGTGPDYVKVGRRVFYLGKDLNTYLDAQRVSTRKEAA